MRVSCSGSAPSQNGDLNVGTISSRKGFILLLVLLKLLPCDAPVFSVNFYLHSDNFLHKKKIKCSFYIFFLLFLILNLIITFSSEVRSLSAVLNVKQFIALSMLLILNLWMQLYRRYVLCIAEKSMHFFSYMGCFYSGNNM